MNILYVVLGFTALTAFIYYAYRALDQAQAEDEAEDAKNSLPPGTTSDRRAAQSMSISYSSPGLNAEDVILGAVIYNELSHPVDYQGTPQEVSFQGGGGESGGGGASGSWDDGSAGPTDDCSSDTSSDSSSCDSSSDSSSCDSGSSDSGSSSSGD